jgi:hypothetical protein
VTRGWPLFVVICALACAPLVDRRLGQIAVAVLGVLYLLTLTSIKQASAGRSSGEAVQTTRERDQSAF